METTIVYWGSYWDNGKKMETIGDFEGQVAGFHDQSFSEVYATSQSITSPLQSLAKLRQQSQVMRLMLRELSPKGLATLGMYH